MRLGRVALVPVAIVVVATGAALSFRATVCVSRWKRPFHARCSERFRSAEFAPRGRPRTSCVAVVGPFANDQGRIARADDPPGNRWQRGRPLADRRNGAGAAECASGRLSVEKARIKSGTIGYFDARSGNSQTPANSTLNQPIENSVVRPVAVTHSAAYRAVPTLFSATLHNAKSFLHGKPAMRW